MKQTERASERAREGDAEISARRGRQYDVTRWEMGRRKKRGGAVGGVKLSCRCYQVKPPTTGCRYGDTMVTTRCSTRKEQDLAYVKGLPLCVFLPHYFFLHQSHSGSFSGIVCVKVVCI